jgi:hypothetical protein
VGFPSHDASMDDLRVLSEISNGYYVPRAWIVESYHTNYAFSYQKASL